MNGYLMWVTSAINWNASPCCFEKGMLYCNPLLGENRTFKYSPLVTSVILKAYHWLASHPGWVKKAPTLLREAHQFSTSSELQLWHLLPHFEKTRIWLKCKTNSTIYVFRRYWQFFSEIIFFSSRFTYFCSKFVPSPNISLGLFVGWFLSLQKKISK